MFREEINQTNQDTNRALYPILFYWLVQRHVHDGLQANFFKFQCQGVYRLYSIHKSTTCWPFFVPAHLRPIQTLLYSPSNSSSFCCICLLSSCKLTVHQQDNHYWETKTKVFSLENIKLGKNKQVYTAYTLFRRFDRLSYYCNPVMYMYTCSIHQESYWEEVRLSETFHQLRFNYIQVIFLWPPGLPEPTERHLLSLRKTITFRQTNIEYSLLTMLIHVDSWYVFFSANFGNLPWLC